MVKGFLKGGRAKRFEALQHVLVPLSRQFDSQQSEEAKRLINRLLDDRPFLLKFRLAFFFRMIDLFSLLKRGRTFKNLSSVHQEMVLNSLFDSSVGLLRKGFWGVNTLAKLGVYGQTSIYPQINYRLKEIPDE